MSAKTKAPPRRTILWIGCGVLIAAAVVLYLVFLRGGGRFSGATGDASVLLITIDTLRADHLGAYGDRDIRTPVIDTLADEGVLFENAITPAIETLPSHATILTGTWPPTHGIRDNGDYRLSPEALTLAEVLRARGFRTGAVVGAFVLDSMFGLDQGFEEYDDALPARSPNEAFFAERPARSVTEAALGFLRQARASRFFLWVHYFDPHHPYNAPAPFPRQYPRRPYDAEIAYVDSEIGRLLAGLKEMGLKDRTLIVLVADHGEGLGDHGEDSHGIFPYVEEARVPLVVSMPPHVPSGVRVKGVVRTVDIMPTVLELMRIDPHEAAAPAQGESLWPLISAGDRRMPGRTAYTEAMAPLLLYGWSPTFAIQDDKYKFIEAPRPELYDLAADPKERDNLAATHPDLVADYRARLETLRKTIAREGAGAEMLSPDAETMARLRSLGYASGGGRTPSTTGNLADPKDMIGMLARINRVYVSFGAGQYDVAVREAASILRENPGNASVRFYMAGALSSMGRYPEAIHEFETLLQRSPKDTVAMSNIGWCLINMQRFDEATAVFNKVLEIFPEHIHAMASLANISFIKGEYNEAVRRYKEVLLREPNHVPSILTLGSIYEGAGKLDEAAVIYAHGAEVDPGNVEMWMSLGWVRFLQGKHDEALATLRRAQEIAPDAPELQVAMGDVELALGQVDEARASYEKGLRLAPRLAGAYYGLGLIETKQGDAGRAVQLMAQAVSLNPERVEWREDLARALARAGRHAEAAGEIEKYLSSGRAPAERVDELRKQAQSYRRGG
ncbi:MAG TPA: sulfatase-like hydrolase/transferase [Patescibacteria group bacterium]|nr:sulfatase-like hydrolase/transferase [Patescibacteria group bacterium]